MFVLASYIYHIFFVTEVLVHSVYIYIYIYIYAVIFTIMLRVSIEINDQALDLSLRVCTSQLCSFLPSFNYVQCHIELDLPPISSFLYPGTLLLKLSINL